MMPIAFISDVHVGNHRRCGGSSIHGLNDRCRKILLTLQAAGDLVVQEGCTALFVLGDLFETSEPGPRVVSATMEVLQDINNRLIDGVVLLTGNHDMASMHPGDNALGPIRWPVRGVVDSPDVFKSVDGAMVGLVPYFSGSAKDLLDNILSEMENEASQWDVLTKRVSPSARSIVREPPTSHNLLRCLVLHLGIAHPGTPPFLLGSHDSIDYKQLKKIAGDHDYSHVLAGHWHRHWSDGALVQVGALCPRGWQDEGPDDYGRVVIIDGAKVTVHEIGGPRFLSASGPEGLARAISRFSKQAVFDSTLYLDWKVSAAMFDQANAEMLAAVESGVVYKGTVRVDDKEVTAMARKDAAAVRSMESLDSALIEYVNAMDLPKGLTPEAVLKSTRFFLSKEVK